MPTSKTKTDEGENRQQLLQIMTTEHFVLGTARAATIQEANQRANLFLTSVSSATIALAFVAQVTRMGLPFVLFSLILLPCLYFLGLVTFVRAVQVAVEDMVHARGMARIRHFYTELAPSMTRYLVHSTHDNQQALLADVGLQPRPWQAFTSTAGMVNVVNGAIAGVFAGVMTNAVLGSTVGLAVAAGILAFVVSNWCLWQHHARSWAGAEHKLKVLFPDAPGRDRMDGAHSG
ncbi:hypothetical protein NKH55_13645 [Mesorhizobium opportunistum]|uniref:hypothetical protein n=1 Tax=Mesorhizobium opportunistum TaxID=593909 RepID=UPI0033358C18